MKYDIIPKYSDFHPFELGGINSFGRLSLWLDLFLDTISNILLIFGVLTFDIYEFFGNYERRFSVKAKFFYFVEQFGTAPLIISMLAVIFTK